VRTFIGGVYVSQDKKVHYELSEEDIDSWILAINDELGGRKKPKKFISLRLVTYKEMCKLNLDFRGINRPTNVLAFPSQSEIKNDQNNLIGDIAICVDELKKEAKEQQKRNKDHLAHLFIHGALHLMGFDHRNKSDRNYMEGIEIKILYQLGIDDPY